MQSTLPYTEIQFHFLNEKKEVQIIEFKKKHFLAINNKVSAVLYICSIPSSDFPEKQK